MTTEKIREVTYNPRHAIPQFEAKENGVDVPYFPNLNAEDRKTQELEVRKALRWAGKDIEAVEKLAAQPAPENENPNSARRRAIEKVKAFNHQFDLIAKAYDKQRKLGNIE